MSFLLRAALVIGTLSYLALVRDRPGSGVDAAGIGSPAAATDKVLSVSPTGSILPSTNEAASAIWSALPTDARQRLAQEAVAEFGRRVGATPASRDTLAEADRRTAWRGVEARRTNSAAVEDR